MKAWLIEGDWLKLTPTEKFPPVSPWDPSKFIVVVFIHSIALKNWLHQLMYCGSLFSPPLLQKYPIYQLLLVFFCCKNETKKDCPRCEVKLFANANRPVWRISFECLICLIPRCLTILFGFQGNSPNCIERSGLNIRWNACVTRDVSAVQLQSLYTRQQWPTVTLNLLAKNNIKWNKINRRLRPSLLNSYEMKTKLCLVGLKGCFVHLCYPYVNTCGINNGNRLQKPRPININHWK